MAQVQDRKSEVYRQKQSVREESSAPLYLESAGDVLIKSLARKQLCTLTTLKEQLELSQDFESGHLLNADLRSGIKSLDDFKKDIAEIKNPTSSFKPEEPQNIEELMKTTGLSRQELELSLCEKPNSEISQLYAFAIRNKKQRNKNDIFGDQLPDHPINRLKEIEEECFGHFKKSSPKLTSTSPQEVQVDDQKVKTGIKKKKKRRKRKKGLGTADLKNSEPRKAEIFPIQDQKFEERPKTSSFRPSLWDVKDMKKWSSCKVQGCSPKTFCTIKNGKIIKLGEKLKGGDAT